MLYDITLDINFLSDEVQESIDMIGASQEDLEIIMQFRNLLSRCGCSNVLLDTHLNDLYDSEDPAEPAEPAPKNPEEPVSQGEGQKKVALDGSFEQIKNSAATKQKIWNFTKLIPEGKNDVSYNAQRLLLTAATGLVLNDSKLEAEKKTFDAVKEILRKDIGERDKLFDAEVLGAAQKVATDAYASFAQGSDALKNAAKNALLEKLA